MRLLFFVGGLPVNLPFPPPYAASAHAAEVFRRSAGKLSNSSPDTYEAAATVLRSFEISCATDAMRAGLGFYLVKVGKGKTDKSVRVTISVTRGESHFFAPATMVVKTSAGATYLPAWFVQKALAELRARSRPSQNYNRIPLENRQVPQALRHDYLQSLIACLPSEAEIEAHKEAQRKAKAAQAEARAIAAEQAKIEAREREEQATAAKKKHADRLSALPRQEHVQVSWIEWVKFKGRFQPNTKIANDVTVVTSGKRAYVVFPDGSEKIVSTSNLTVLEPAAG
jgi:hypothetical protein